MPPMHHPDPQPSTGTQVRLNKFLSTAGIASRRRADEMIQEGLVRVNGKVVTSLGVKIDPARDQVFVNEKQVVLLDEPVYIVFNKPNDSITTARDERGRTTVMDYIQVKERIFPIGRLDRKTTGVLLFTNDGEFANRLMHPSHEVKKAYQATLDKPLTPEHAMRLAQGIRLSDGVTKPAEIFAVPGMKNKTVGIVIHEGRNRQLHRMFEALGYTIEKLDRVAYAGISYEGIPRGSWRYLTKVEINTLEHNAKGRESVPLPQEPPRGGASMRPAKPFTKKPPRGDFKRQRAKPFRNEPAGDGANRHQPKPFRKEPPREGTTPRQERPFTKWPPRGETKRQQAKPFTRDQATEGANRHHSKPFRKGPPRDSMTPRREGPFAKWPPRSGSRHHQSKPFRNEPAGDGTNRYQAKPFRKGPPRDSAAPRQERPFTKWPPRSDTRHPQSKPFRNEPTGDGANRYQAKPFRKGPPRDGTGPSREIPFTKGPPRGGQKRRPSGPFTKGQFRGGKKRFGRK